MLTEGQTRGIFLTEPFSEINKEFKCEKLAL